MLVVLALAVGVAMALVVSVSFPKQASAATNENLLRNLTITSTTIDTHTKEVTVKGNVTFASGVEKAWVGVHVSQVVGRVHTVEGAEEKAIRGDKGLVPFTFTFSAWEGRFAPGKATLEGYAATYVRSEGTWDEDDLEPYGVRLVSNH